jgi:hypothetical protein
MSEQLPKNVRITEGSGWYENEVGNVYKVTGVSDNDYYTIDHPENDDVKTHLIEKAECEPIDEEVTATEGDDKSIIDLLANLARRVTSIERYLRFDQMGAGRLVEIENQIGDIKHDLRTFAEQTESNTHDIAFLEDKIDGDGEVCNVEDVYPELSRFSPLQRTILASDLPLDLALMLVNEAQEIEDINRKRVENSRPNVGVAE